MCIFGGAIIVTLGQIRQINLLDLSCKSSSHEKESVAMSLNQDF